MDASTILTGAITSLEGEAAVIVPAALAVGVTLFAVKRGYAWFRSFAK